MRIGSEEQSVAQNGAMHTGEADKQVAPFQWRIFQKLLIRNGKKPAHIPNHSWPLAKITALIYEFYQVTTDGGNLNGDFSGVVSRSRGIVPLDSQYRTGD